MISRINNSTFASYYNGLPPIPDLLFASSAFICFGVGDLRFAPIALTQKVSKKVKTPPASLEKFAFGRLKSSKLVEVRPKDCNCESEQHELQLQTRTIFNRLPLLFFGSPAEVARQRAASICEIFHFLLHVKIACVFCGYF